MKKSGHLLAGFMWASSFAFAQETERPLLSLKTAEERLVAGDANGAIDIFLAVATSVDATEREQAVALGGLGLSYAAIKQTDKARSNLGQSVDRAISAGALDVAAKSTFNLGLLDLSGLDPSTPSSNWFNDTRGTGTTREVFVIESESPESSSITRAISEL